MICEACKQESGDHVALMDARHRSTQEVLADRPP